MNINLADINLLDAGFALALVLFVVRGLLRGMISEIAGLVGIFLGFFVSGRYYPKLIPQVNGFISDPMWAGAIAYILVFAGVLVVVALVAVAIRKFMSLTFTAWFDHAGGAVIGAAKGVLLCSLALALLDIFLPSSPFLKTSVLAKKLTDVTSVVRTFLPSQDQIQNFIEKHRQDIPLKKPS